MSVWLFHRDMGDENGICFYPVRKFIPNDKTEVEAILDHIELNPETLKVTEYDGTILWERTLN